jgi:hypothetical protein
MEDRRKWYIAQKLICTWKKKSSREWGGEGKIKNNYYF